MSADTASSVRLGMDKCGISAVARRRGLLEVTHHHQKLHDEVVARVGNPQDLVPTA